MDKQDKAIKCEDCGIEFTFTVSEQEFFEKNGFSDPKRCADCRRKRKDAKNNRSNNNYAA